MVDSLRKLDACASENRDVLESLRTRNKHFQFKEKELHHRIENQDVVIAELQDELTKLVDDKMDIVRDHDHLKKYLRRMQRTPARKMPRSRSSSAFLQ